MSNNHVLVQNVPGRADRSAPSFNTTIVPVNKFNQQRAIVGSRNGPYSQVISIGAQHYVSVENHSAHTFAVEFRSPTSGNFTSILYPDAIIDLAIPFANLADVTLTDIVYQTDYLQGAVGAEQSYGTERSTSAFPYTRPRTVSTGVPANAQPSGYLVVSTSDQQIDIHRSVRVPRSRPNWTQSAKSTGVGQGVTVNDADAILVYNAANQAGALAAGLFSALTAINNSASDMTVLVYYDPQAGNPATFIVQAGTTLSIDRDFSSATVVSTAAGQQLIAQQTVKHDNVYDVEP